MPAMKGMGCVHDMMATCTNTPGLNLRVVFAQGPSEWYSQVLTSELGLRCRMKAGTPSPPVSGAPKKREVDDRSGFGAFACLSDLWTVDSGFTGTLSVCNIRTAAQGVAFKNSHLSIWVGFAGPRSFRYEVRPGCFCSLVYVESGTTQMCSTNIATRFIGFQSGPAVRHRGLRGGRKETKSRSGGHLVPDLSHIKP